MINCNDLITHLTLVDAGNNQFIGTNIDIGSPAVFGGQVVAQALHAAYKTIPENRILHSLHSYFLEAGNLQKPITYLVDEIRNGGSFSTRRVTATQGKKTIFILAASFHKTEKGHEYQTAIKTTIKQPEDLISWTEMVSQFGDFMPKKLKYFLSIDRPVEFKPTVINNPLEQKNLPATVDVWFKLKDNQPNLQLAIKQQILAYISDYNILNATLNPHASIANYDNTQMASLDHSMWFYRDFDFDDWMLISVESPNTFGARGFVRGNIFTRDGQLIASVAQEGLMRPMKKK